MVAFRGPLLIISSHRHFPAVPLNVLKILKGVTLLDLTQTEQITKGQLGRLLQDSVRPMGAFVPMLSIFF